MITGEENTRRWTESWRWFFPGFLLVLLIANLIARQWVDELIVVSFACGHFASRLDSKKNRANKIAQIALMFAGTVFGVAYFYFKYKLGWR